MKKYIVLTIVAFVVAIIIFTIFQNGTEIQVQAFDFDEYLHYVEEFPSNENCDNVSAVADVCKAAEKIWVAQYGLKVLSQKPYKVFYDSAKDVWMVTGTLPKIYDVGGTAHILIKKSTGNVLAVWHGR